MTPRIPTHPAEGFRKKRTKNIASADWVITAQLVRSGHVIGEAGPLPISDAYLNTQFYEAGMVVAQFLDEKARAFQKTETARKRKR